MTIEEFYMLIGQREVQIYQLGKKFNELSEAHETLKEDVKRLEDDAILMKDRIAELSQNQE